MNYWALGAALLLALNTAGAQQARRGSGQPRDKRNSVNAHALSQLDLWIVGQFRGAQLLRDTIVEPVMANAAAYPRVETVRRGDGRDTLFAIDFTLHPTDAVLPRNGVARLAASAGAISSLAPMVLARRPFRAPRVPNANNTRAADWRYGWAYVATVRITNVAGPGSTPSPGRLRGWLLLGSPSALSVQP